MFAFVRESPLYLILLAYAGLALALAAAAWNLSRAWLRSLARRSPSDLHDVFAASLPRPIGGAAFLLAIDVGLRWLPLGASGEGVAHRFLRFGLGILVVLSLTRLGRKAIDGYGRSNPALRSSSGIGKAIIWVIGLCTTAILGSDALGISLAPALTALGVGSLAVALALQDTLSNFFSGIYLLVDKPCRPGEFVRLDCGQEGYVEAIGWRATLLRTLAPSVIIVPNATMAKSVLTNFRLNNPRLSFEIRVDVALDSDRDKVERALLAEALGAIDIQGIRRDPVPTVRFVPGVSRRALGFTLYYSVEPSADAALVQGELRKRLLSRVHKEKIALPSPTFVGVSADKDGATSSSSAS